MSNSLHGPYSKPQFVMNVDYHNFAAMYKALRAVLFLFDPEKVHYLSMNFLRVICKVGPFKKLIQSWYTPESEQQFTFLDISFPNRVGLGAGFDKNAKYLDSLEALGFGFVEIGTVTPIAQDGNDKPRLFRLTKDKALINRMGFNNDGVESVVRRLKDWRLKRLKSKNHTHSLIIGGNIGKNKSTPNDEAWKDYETCFNALHPWVDYFVVNVSSPNTPGLRELQEKASLSKILKHLLALNAEKEMPKPVLLKIAPDLTKEQVDDVVELSMEINLSGLIVSNTTISRENLVTDSITVDKIGAGGLSGLPIRTRSTEMIAYIKSKTNGSLPVIGSGGIFSATDANEKINSGAALVQVWTGFIYEGPSIVKNICKELKHN